MLPPWVRPESPETLRWIDDATQAFPPAFGRGTTQRGIWADPRWGLRRRYRGLRSDEKAAILNALNETRGQLNILRVTPHAPIRGSFATSELLTNNTFASGTTGWTGGADYSISVSDRVLRSRRTGITALSNLLTSSSLTVVPYAPYALRTMCLQGRGAYPSGFAVGPGSLAPAATATGAFGLHTKTYVPLSTSDDLRLQEIDVQSSGVHLAGNYVLIPYASFTRCAQVDNAPNALLQSDTLATTWTQLNLSSISSNSQVAPDGTTTADTLIENGATGSHGISQSAARSSVAADICAYGYFTRVAGTRNLLLVAGNDGTDCGQALFNLSSGAVSGVTNNGTATNTRAFSASAGSYVFCCVIARCPAAATLANFALMHNGVSNSYTGDGASAIIGWRLGAAVSGVPTRGGQTVASALASGTTQTGSALYTKGWPASTDGLLLAGDWFEINGELKQLTAPVNSDAAGLAYMQFRPGLAGAPADNDPIIVHEPFGRFIYPAGTRELENLFGIYGDCEMNLEEIYA